MMSMLNQAAVEALCSATYLENYLSCTENLPDDLQRVVSQLREWDVVMHDVIVDIQTHQDTYMAEGDGNKKQRALVQIQRGLIRSQEIEDEKLQLVGHVIEHIDSRARQLEQDLENLDPTAAAGFSDEMRPKTSTSTNSTVTPTPARSAKAMDSNNTPVVVKTEDKMESTPVTTKNKRARRQRMQVEVVKEEKKDEEDQKPPKKKKKRKVKSKGGGIGNDKAGDKSPLDFQDIDPDEPTYCLCDQVSYGEMIGCDNDTCPIEWFHFNCVQLIHKPKGKWYCPKCRGDKPTVKRPDLK